MPFHRSKTRDITVERVASHRNGICGTSFCVVLFRTDADKGNDPMIGVVFDTPGHVAVFNRELVGQCMIDFYVNSWRGDEYETGLRQAVADYRKTQELLPSDKWAAGWSPATDPLPEGTMAELPADYQQDVAKRGAFLNTVGVVISDLVVKGKEPK